MNDPAVSGPGAAPVSPPSHLFPPVRPAPSVGAYGPIAAVCALSAVALFWRLGQASLHDWDEAIYAQISREMLQHRNWLSPTWNGQPWFDKPPLYMWCTAALYRILGVSELSARAVSAVCAVLVIGLTYAIAADVYTRRVAVLSVGITLTSFQFVHSARSGMTDMMLTLFIYLALYACLQVRRGSARWWYVLGAACGLAIMTKSSAGFAAPMIVIVALTLDGTLRTAIRSIHARWALALCLLVFLPWHIYMYLRFGSAFLQDYLGTHGTTLVTQGIDRQTGGPFYYVDRLRTLFFPWVYVLPFALMIALAQSLKARRRSRVLLGSFAVMFIAYTLVHMKVGWYILPLYPAMAILSAALLDQAGRTGDSVALSSLLIGSFIVVLGSSPKAVVVLLLLGAIVFVVYLWHRSSTRRAIAGALCLFLLAVGIDQVGPLYHDGTSSVQTLFDTVPGAHDPRAGRLIVVGGDLVPSVVFYSHRRVDQVDTPGKLSSVIRNTHPRDVVLGRPDLARVPREYVVQVIKQVGPLAYAVIRARPTDGTQASAGARGPGAGTQAGGPG